MLRSWRDPFGNLLLLKGLLTSLLGLLTYPGLNLLNRLRVSGLAHLHDLPDRNVLFVANHQTYFTDVIALYHVFGAAKWRLRQITWPVYLLAPRVRCYYVAAEETMKEGGWLPKLFSYAGAVLVKRSWRKQGEAIQRGADFRSPAKIKRALDYGWVINFPQGTTSPGAPVRKGAANMIKAFQPLVVPVRIGGFDRAFDKKGLRFRQLGTRLTIEFGTPVQFGEAASWEEIYSFLEERMLGQPHSSTARP
jgi:1-acyl-sn-glycerol-3-phosphate acyltransferase